MNFERQPLDPNYFLSFSPSLARLTILGKKRLLSTVALRGPSVNGRGSCSCEVHWPRIETRGRGYRVGNRGSPGLEEKRYRGEFRRVDDFTRSLSNHRTWRNKRRLLRNPRRGHVTPSRLPVSSKRTGLLLVKFRQLFVSSWKCSSIYIDKQRNNKVDAW